MADFFSQFQVHPPQDFSLGGFAPDQTYTGPTGAASAGIGGTSTVPPIDFQPQGPYTTPSDPPLTTMPQPWQQFLPGSAPNDPTPPGQWDGRSPYFQSPMPPGWTPHVDNFGNSPIPSLGPAAQMGPNGPTYTNGQGQSTNQFGTPLANGIGQPMNPSQQSGMVLMRSPDGMHMQQVPEAHVDHYTGLGATQVTGPQLTGSSYGGSF